MWMEKPRLAQLQDINGAAWRRILRPDFPGDAPKEWADVSYVSPDGRLACGIWCAEAGSLPIHDYPVHETCWVLDGNVVIIDEYGKVAGYSAGTAFVLPLGFIGTWMMDSPAVKQFAMYGPEAVITNILGSLQQEEPLPYVLR